MVGELPTTGRARNRESGFPTQLGVLSPPPGYGTRQAVPGTHGGTPMNGSGAAGEVGSGTGLRVGLCEEDERRLNPLAHLLSVLYP